MNHKNVIDVESRDYYLRCISRWNSLISSPCEKIGVYIHPLMSYGSYSKKHLRIRCMITDFHKDMCDATAGYRGIYVIPVRWLGECSTQNIERDEYTEGHIVSPGVVPSLIRIAGVNAKTMSYPNPVYFYSPIPNMYLCVLYVREEFIDAGEIFMGECNRETDLLASLIVKVGNKETIAYSSGLL